MLLARTHRNFLIALCVILVFHVWQAGVHLFGPEAAFSSPSLREVYRFADPTLWGAAHVLCAAFMVVGMWRTSTFWIARIGVAIGLAVVALRFLLLMRAADLAATGLPTWFLAAGMHVSCALEPPSNPATTA